MLLDQAEINPYLTELEIIRRDLETLLTPNVFGEFLKSLLEIKNVFGEFLEETSKEEKVLTPIVSRFLRKLKNIKHLCDRVLESDGVIRQRRQELSGAHQETRIGKIELTTQIEDLEKLAQLIPTYQFSKEKVKNLRDALIQTFRAVKIGIACPYSQIKTQVLLKEVEGKMKNFDALRHDTQKLSIYIDFLLPFLKAGEREEMAPAIKRVG